jgi:hypothetical protein
MWTLSATSGVGRWLRYGIAAGCATTIGLATAPADAATPDRGYYDVTESFVDTQVCAATPWGFDVAVIQHEYGFYDVFTDKSGEVSYVLVHQNYDATISANGHTIIERDTWQLTAYPDGTVRESGLTVHIQGPGGIVNRDAGQVVFNPDGSVSYTRGPHEQLSGESFCPALAP